MQRELHPTLLSSLEGIVDQMVWFRENWHEEVFAFNAPSMYGSNKGKLTAKYLSRINFKHQNITVLISKLMFVELTVLSGV